MPDNRAAFLVAKGQPIEVKPASYEDPKDDQIIVRTRALAMNPCDCVAQMLGDTLFPYIRYPHIWGEDVSGDVVAVGSGVKGFKVGDRVAGQSNNAFQTFPPIPAHLAAKIPESMSYERAAVIPLGFTTAFVGLFGDDFLALQRPSVDAKAMGETVLIWGGSTSVGCNAVQLAVCAGYDVISTCSPHNFDLVHSLGASKVLDYKSPTITQDLIKEFKGKKCAGAMAIGNITPEATKMVTEACIEVVYQSEGRKFVALSMPPREDMPKTVASKFIDASKAQNNRAFAAELYNHFLTKALATGKFVPAPSPEVVGTGLGAVQHAIDLMGQGVSAKKLIVTV